MKPTGDDFNGCPLLFSLHLIIIELRFLRRSITGVRRMNGNMSTIAAISTPFGTSGIGIVRMSGPEAFEIAEKIFISGKAFSEIKTHTVTHGKIVDPSDGRMIDDVLLVKMAAPRTFTGEDIVEINCHGGTAVLRNVLELLLKNGRTWRVPANSPSVRL